MEVALRHAQGWQTSHVIPEKPTQLSLVGSFLIAMLLRFSGMRHARHAAKLGSGMWGEHRQSYFQW